MAIAEYEEDTVPSETKIQLLREFGPRSLEQRTLSLDALRLDPNNVRFRHLGHPLTDKEAEEALWKEPDSKTLFQEILIAGGLSEPIYVRRQDNGTYLVKEGSRRVTCLRHGQREAEAGNVKGFKPADFAKVPAFILDDSITAEEEAILEARWHVMGAGKKQWPAFNQSAHIWAMHHRLGMPVAKISDALGMSKPTVYKKLRAYEAMVEYQGQTGDKDLKKFSFFDVAYNTTDVNKWLSEDAANLHDLIKWINEGKFNRTGARDMRDLMKVLGDKPARETFIRKDFDSAYAIFSKGNPEVDSATFRVVREALDALKSIPRSEIQQVATDPKRKEMLLALIEEINGVLREAETHAPAAS